MQQIFRFVLLAVLCAALTACVSRPREAPAIRTIQPMEAVEGSTFDAKHFATRAAQPDNDNVHTVLALSAGGADGAYGAGVLNGWTKSGKRPEFDVVTGVSTGALMAVAAFLGKDYDDELEDFYTNSRNEDIYRANGGGFFGESLYDNGPLKERIAEFVDAELLAKVAAEHAKGRRLYVATTNLDAGDLVIWDMGDIADGGRSDDVQHFQKVLRASASVPAFFPPVYIKPQRGIQLRQAHVDGAVKEPILVKSFMFPDNRGKKELYMIVNGNTTRLNASQPVQPKALEIAKKAIMEMMRELQEETIYRGFVIAGNVRSSYHLTNIPDSIPMSQASLNFDPKRMRRLYDAGFQAGLSGPDKWEKEPPRLEKFERLASR
ncbi:MAG: patatin-like phospholipase family protein [Rhizobiaceae bacterium]